MRILTYKRTHVGDPDQFGRFGVHDCMGKVRGFSYDAIIGVGGIGHEARSHGIDRKLTWVGIGPKRSFRVHGYRASVFEFEHFVRFDSAGPLLHSLAPNLARKIYCGRRYILDAYSETEKAEAVAIVEWAQRIANGSETLIFSLAKKGSCRTNCRMPLNPSFHRTCAKNRAGPVNSNV